MNYTFRCSRESVFRLLALHFSGEKDRNAANAFQYLSESGWYIMKIKVFTFNLRTESKNDGVNYFPNRRGRILDTIKAYAPDIIGFQEATDYIREWLRDSLEDYMVVGCGRGKNYRGESTIIAFRKSEFDMISFETFWLSLTPGIPGTGYGLDQSTCPRITTSALLKPLNGGEPFIFCNTHLDHKGKTARLLGSVQLIQYLTSKPYKFVLTGDFNATPDAPEITVFSTVKDHPITDATAGLGGTFHGFSKSAVKVKIDYIFTDLPCDASESFIIPDEGNSEGIFISDHHPVCAFVEV